MKGEQLNLFDQPQRKAMAEIIVFPVDREIAFVRETARILSVKQGPSAQRFWQMTCRRLYARLQVKGLADPDIQNELSRFARAVYARLDPTISNNPKGAA